MSALEKGIEDLMLKEKSILGSKLNNQIGL